MVPFCSSPNLKSQVANVTGLSELRLSHSEMKLGKTSIRNLWTVGAAAICFVTPGPLSTTARIAPSTFSMTPEQFWYRGYAVAPWIPLAGDADGDGHADLLALAPGGACVIDMARTSPLGKVINGGGTILSNFGNDAIAAACGPFVRRGAADVLGVYRDGSIRVAWGMTPGTRQYMHNDVSGLIPLELLPKGTIKTAVGDFQGKGHADLLLLGEDGRLVLLRNLRAGDQTPQFEVHPFRASLPNVRQLSAGVLAGSPNAQLVWLDSSGGLSRSPVEIAPDGSATLSRTTLVFNASPDDHIAVGHFRGDKVADILVGRQLLAGGVANSITVLSDIPPLEVAKDDFDWAVGDIDGNGKDDLIRFRRGHERFRENDTFIHFSYDASDKDKGYFCSSNDGLPDFWKTGRVKPAGLDLAALGCKVGHRDIVLQVERFTNLDEKYVKDNLARAASYFASLPIKNPDGTSGIALHMIYEKPFLPADHDRIMAHFDEIFPPKEYRGIVHTVFAEGSGPLVSKICGDNSHYNGGWKEFLHEFGHELDLTHEGFYPTQACPLYPSLMNYTYSYSVGDDGDKAGYSDGSFASLVLHPLHLPKHLPFPIDKLKCLAGGPYHYRLKADADGKGTYVDWNWSGLFDDSEVSACINYSHGAYLGPRFDIAKSQTAPVLVAHGEGPKPKLLLIYGQSTSHASRLLVRSWLGTDRDAEPTHWSDEVQIADSGVLSDPTAAYLSDGVTWVTYLTSSGVVVRPITFDTSGKLTVGAEKLVPQSAGAQPTITAFDDRLALLLWRSRTEPVGLRFLRAGGTDVTMGRESKFDFFSEVPVAAVAGLTSTEGASLWVTRIDGSETARKGRTEAIRYLLGPDRVLKEAERSFIDGVYATHRMSLLWQKEPGLLPQGRLYLFGGGRNSPKQPWSEQYYTENVPYKEMGGGWLIRRYEQPSFTSLSASTACFYDGNIVYALRRFDTNPNNDDNVTVCFYGSGANQTPEGDFDDITHIRDIGLSRSIPFVTQ